MDEHLAWLWEQLKNASELAEESEQSHELVSVVNTGIALMDLERRVKEDGKSV